MLPSTEKKRHPITRQKLLCKNCGYPLKQQLVYCPSCGAKYIAHRLTPRNLAEDFSERFLNLENTFIKTFISLFTQPDDVIDGYITGVRKRYTDAFNYFAIALAIAGFYAFFYKQFFAETYYDWFSSFSDDAVDGQTRASFDLSNKIQDYQGVLTFSMIPLLAVISRLTFLKNKKYNYIEHLIIYLYAYSHVSLITSVLYILTMWSSVLFLVTSTLTTVFPVLYFPYVFKKLYHLNTENTILKTLLSWGISIMIFTVLSIAGMFIAYKLGLLDEVIEEVKRSQVK